MNNYELQHQLNLTRKRFNKALLKAKKELEAEKQRRLKVHRERTAS